MNKYLISVDIEGITGVINRDFANKNGKYHKQACRYMTHDTNAVVQGILNADSDAFIVVRDAHDYDAVNLDLETLHPKANLVQGWGAMQDILAGLDQTFKGVFLVGFHAGGQNNKAILGHTLHSITHHIKINDQLINETGWAAFCASHCNVPVAFISGDDHAVKEAKEQLGEIVGVEVKKSFARDSGISLSLEQAQLLLEKGAEEATIKLQKNQFPVFEVSIPVTLEISFYNTGYKISIFQSLSKILGFDSTYKFDHKKLTLSFETNNALETAQRLNMIMFLVYGVSSSA
jgi:D-amino peptidase